MWCLAFRTRWYRVLLTKLHRNVRAGTSTRYIFIVSKFRELVYFVIPCILLFQNKILVEILFRFGYLIQRLLKRM